MSESHKSAVPVPANAGHGFARRGWFDLLAQHCFTDRRCLWPRVEQDGMSVTLPLMEDGGTLASLSNYYSFSYEPIFTGEPSRAMQQMLLGSIAAPLRIRYDRISFYPLVDENLAHLLRDAFAAAGWIALLTDQNSNHYLDVDGRDFATYWASRPGQLRSAVKRKAQGAALDFTVHDHITDAIWDEYLAVYSASWKNAEPYPAFVRAMAEDAARRGVLRLGIAHLEGAPVAAQLWTIEGPTACLHKLAHDSAQDRHSPGTLLSHHMFEQMIDHEKVERIDYGTGNNAYKRDWMECARPMLKLDCFNPRSARMWLPALRTRISQLVRRPD